MVVHQRQKPTLTEKRNRMKSEITEYEEILSIQEKFFPHVQQFFYPVRDDQNRP